MSQVKNLRAMFENKGDDSSPPDRGRSPGPSGSITPSASFTGSPRPLSRIRSSFVAIEKDGRMGLQRAISDEGSLPRRRMSGDTDAESISATSDNRSTTATGEEPRTARRMFINDPIPESPRLPKEVDGFSHDLGAVTDQPSVNPDKHVDEEEPSKNLLSADPTTAIGATAKTPAGAKIVNGKPASGQTTVASPGPAKSSTLSTTKKIASRPSAISTKATGKATIPSKSPATVKTPTSATSSTAQKSTARTATRTAVKRDTTSTATRPAGSTATKPTASSASKKPAPLKPSTSGTGFVKPKVKSPTKPVSLPASLMAPTAASGAKGNAPRPSLTPQTGNAQARASSRASISTGTSKYPKAPVSKHPRPSIGPPPKTSNREKPAARESNVDEGFLARMMRPTASSAQKTAEKVQLTPPKRTAGRRSTTSSHRDSSIRSSSRAKTPSVHASEAAEDHNHHAPLVDEIAVNTAILETTEEAAEGAPETDLALSSAKIPESASETAAAEEEPVHRQDAIVQHDASAEALKSSPVTENIVPQTAVVDTAEEAVELAAETDQVQDTLHTDIDGHQAVSEPSSLKEVSVEDSVIEAATTATAEEPVAVSEEADLIQTPAEPPIAEPELPNNEDLAEESTNAKSSGDAAVAEDVQASAESKDPSVAADEQQAGEVTEQPGPVKDALDAEPAAAEVKTTTPASPNDSDIDSLAEKLAETRIEAGDEKEVDEEVKGTR